MASDEPARKSRGAPGGLPIDPAALEPLVRSQAALAERLSSIAIGAAQRSTEQYARWVQDTLSKLPAATRAQAAPADYARAAGDFMSGSAEAAAEHLAAFAEIAKSVQAETLALLLTAGKDLPPDGGTPNQAGAATSTEKGSST